MTTGFDITNEDRAELALAAVQAFADRTNQSGQQPIVIDELRATSDLVGGENWMAREIVGDLLCDLLHLLGEEVFDQALESGRGHYEAELCRFCGGTAEDYGVCDDCGPLRCSRCEQLVADTALCADGAEHTPMWMEG